VLIGRNVERARIDRLLDGARQGDSGVLVIRGEPGIGKTVLLQYAIGQAYGMRVLRAQGVESESELPFAGLHELLQPLQDRLDRLPGPQAVALASALAIEPPAGAAGGGATDADIDGGGEPPVAGDRFTVSAATLSLLAAAAEDQPVLAVVDDAQWLDGSSAEALAFTARRLHAEGIVLLLGLRETEATTSALESLASLRLASLADDDAIRLLATRQGAVARPIAAQLVRATAGNPLALVELSSLLTPQQLTGQEPLDDPLPVGATVERVFLRRVATLPSKARRALVVAAASDAVAVEPIIRAIRSLGGTLADLEAAEAAGLVKLEASRLAFHHPLVRSAVYQHAPAPTRRAAHRALAEAVADAERRAWHLAAATVGPDEQVACDLEAVATNAYERRSYTVACSALERAAHLSLTTEGQVGRLVMAADAAQLAGRINKAMDLLDEALAITNDRRVRARIQHERGRILTWRGAPVMGRELLIAEAAQVATVEPGRTVQMLITATIPCLLTGRADTALRVIREAVRLGRTHATPEVVGKAALLRVLTLLVCGRTRAARRLLRHCGTFLEECKPLTPEQLPLVGALCHLGAENFAESRRLAERTVRLARSASAIGVLPFQLAWLSVIDFRTGSWTSAYAGAHEAIRLAEETGWITEIPNALAALAEVEAGQGRVQDCRAHAAAALAVAEAVDAKLLEIRVLSVLGLLELGLGQAEAASGYLERAVRLAEEHGLREPATFDATADLVEAYLRVGHPRRAAATLETLEGQAAQTRLSSVRAKAARCRGLLDDNFTTHFTVALAAHDEVPMPFDRARTELCFGEVLRRRVDPTKAGRWLRSALATFERLGAAPWVERARAELEATGERAGQQDVSVARRLTPQELQVALTVAQGATVDTAAATLFLSTRTIEFHLDNTYRKLAIRSDTELAQLLGTESAPPQTPAEDGSS
jgi:DNA-binding CsgD family transcriptional regulator/tetratricopeptide (TPR) repeat protein